MSESGTQSAARSRSLDLFATNTSQRLHHRFILRAIGITGFAALALVLPSIGERRVLLALLLLATIPLAASTLYVRNDLALPLQSFIDVVSAAGVIFITPDAWAAALVVVACAPASSSALLGRRAYVFIETFGLCLVFVAVEVGGVDGYGVALSVAAILVPLVASYIDVFIARSESAASQLVLVANSADVIFWDADVETGDLLHFTGRVGDILGYAEADLPTDLGTLVHADDKSRLAEITTGLDSGAQARCRIRHADGHWVWLRMSARHVGSRGQTHLRGVGVDITELVTIAETDDLTGLANRAVLNRELNDLIDSGTQTALIIMDLDRFKEVNDTLGHQTGDRYLQEIARRLSALLNGHQTLARIGGDEFAFIDAGGGIESALSLVEAASLACEEPIELDGMEFAGSASMGIALSPHHSNSATELMRQADIAMYSAKRAGTQYEIYDVTTPGATVDRLTLSGEVDHALRSGQLRLWYQPKIDLKTGLVVGAEGLLRWHHPERGVLRPKDFLDVIEISRHFPALTEALVTQAVETLAQAIDTPELRISVNVSVRSLADPRFTAHTVEALRAANVVPNRLILEITEREIMADRTNIGVMARGLRDRGIGLSIDDFGTGHSSLLRLHELPATELKIDQRFIRGLGRDEDALIIVKTVVELGKRLGHTIVAEGVERQSELETLTELGCDIGQGYLWSEALPRDDFLASLSARTPITP